MEMLKFFSHEKISDRVYVVTENYATASRFTIGVFVGAERILVIDCGLGMCGNLRKYIESFAGTEKPMFCICTDGHTDRVGGAYLFDEAYLNRQDYEKFAASSLDLEHRIKAMEDFTGHNEKAIEYCKELIEDNSDVVFKDIKDDDMFHLGGIRIEIIGMPGHSRGCICVMSRRDKIAFCGDAINTDITLFDLDREGLLAYSDTLNRFLSIVDDEDMNIYSGHKSVPMKVNVVKNLALACEEIANGKTYGDVPANTPFKDREMKVHYVNNVSVTYNADAV